jgi:hypothetical protein
VNAGFELRTHLVHAPAPRYFLALWGALATVDVTRAGDATPVVQVALCAVLAGACAVGQRFPAAVGGAGVVWLVVLGFALHEAGELTPFRLSDLLPLAMMAGVALIVSAATR